MLENIEVRRQVAEVSLRYKDIAKQIGVTPEHLSRCMRYPLKPEMYIRIVTAIQCLREGGGNCESGDRSVSG